MWIPNVNVTSFVSHDEEVLRLNTDIEHIPLTCCVIEHSFQIHTSTTGVRLAIHVDIAGEPGNACFPRERRIAGQVDASHHVVRIGPLPHPPNGGARKPSTHID